MKSMDTQSTRHQKNEGKYRPSHIVFIRSGTRLQRKILFTIEQESLICSIHQNPSTFHRIREGDTALLLNNF